MKRLIIILCLFAFSTASVIAQRTATPEETKAYIEKLQADRIASRAKEHARVDSINNQSLKDYKGTMVKKYGPKTGAKIADSKIQVGYTKDMCLDAWGMPDNERSDGKMESWLYRKYNTALTFKSGKLIKIVDY